MKQIIQTAFDKIWAGAKAQNFEMATNDEGSCVYRNGEGQKCNVGHLIPDDKYQERMEGAYPGTLLEDLVIFKDIAKEGNSPDVREAVTTFLEQAQVAHDDADDAEVHKRRLTNLAKEYELTIEGAAA